MKHIQVDTTENKDKQGLNKQNEIRTQEQMMNNEEHSRTPRTMVFQRERVLTS